MRGGSFRDTTMGLTNRLLAFIAAVLVAVLVLLAVGVAKANAGDRLVLGPKRLSSNTSAYGVGCGGGYTMANGGRVFFGAVASNYLRRNTLIRFERRIYGRRYFRVLDTGGPTIGIDIWMPSCSQAIRFGRHAERYRIVVRRIKR